MKSSIEILILTLVISQSIFGQSGQLEDFLQHWNHYGNPKSEAVKLDNVVISDADIISPDFEWEESYSINYEYENCRITGNSYSYKDNIIQRIGDCSYAFDGKKRLLRSSCSYSYSAYDGTHSVSEWVYKDEGQLDSTNIYYRNYSSNGYDYYSIGNKLFYDSVNKLILQNTKRIDYSSYQFGNSHFDSILYRIEYAYNDNVRTGLTYEILNGNNNILTYKEVQVLDENQFVQQSSEYNYIDNAFVLDAEYFYERSENGLVLDRRIDRYKGGIIDRTKIDAYTLNSDDQVIEHSSQLILEGDSLVSNYLFLYDYNEYGLLKVEQRILLHINRARRLVYNYIPVEPKCNNKYAPSERLNGDSSSFKFSPNPTYGLINLENKHMHGFRMEVFDLNGNLLASGVSRNYLDISHLPSGIYVLAIMDEVTHTRRLERVYKM